MSPTSTDHSPMSQTGGGKRRTTGAGTVVQAVKKQKTPEQILAKRRRKLARLQQKGKGKGKKGGGPGGQNSTGNANKSDGKGSGNNPNDGSDPKNHDQAAADHTSSLYANAGYGSLYDQQQMNDGSGESVLQVLMAGQEYASGYDETYEAEDVGNVKNSLDSGNNQMAESGLESDQQAQQQSGNNATTQTASQTQQGTQSGQRYRGLSERIFSLIIRLICFPICQELQAHLFPSLFPLPSSEGYLWGIYDRETKRNSSESSSAGTPGVGGTNSNLSGPGASDFSANTDIKGGADGGGTSVMAAAAVDKGNFFFDATGFNEAILEEIQHEERLANAAKQHDDHFHGSGGKSSKLGGNQYSQQTAGDRLLNATLGGGGAGEARLAVGRGSRRRGSVITTQSNSSDNDGGGPGGGSRLNYRGGGIGGSGGSNDKNNKEGGSKTIGPPNLGISQLLFAHNKNAGRAGFVQSTLLSACRAETRLVHFRLSALEYRMRAMLGSGLSKIKNENRQINRALGAHFGVIKNKK